MNTTIPSSTVLKTCLLVTLALLAWPVAGQDLELTAQNEPVSAQPAVSTPSDDDDASVSGTEDGRRRETREPSPISGAEDAGSSSGYLLELFNSALTIQLFLLGVMTLGVGMLGLLGLLGFRGWKTIGRYEQDVKERADKVAEHAGAVEAHERSVKEVAQRFGALESRVDEIQEKVRNEFNALPDSFFVAVPGQPPSAPEPATLARFEDMDSVLYSLHYMGLLPDRIAASRDFIKLGRFWRRQLDFGRSTDRIRVAGEQGAESLRVIVGTQLAVTLTNWAGWIKVGAVETDSSVDKDELLAEAWNRVDEVSDSDLIERVDLLYLRGIILHLQGRYAKSADIFREGLSTSLGPQEGEESLVKTTPSIFRYNLSASLCLQGKLEESLKELKRVPQPERKDAGKDADFQALRQSQSLGPSFWRAIEEEEE